MQGFVPERSFTKDRIVIDMRIDSVLMVLRHADQQITDFIGHDRRLGNLLVMAQAGFSATPTQSTAFLMAEEIMPRLKEYEQPEAAQNAPT